MRSKSNNLGLSGTEVVAYSLIICSHAYAFWAFGATYWIDSRDYISLATAMSALRGLQVFYETVGQWIFSHLGPGLPALWLFVAELPTAWQWPVLAVFQHSLAAGALIFAFRTIYRLWPSPVHLIFVLLLLLLPLYQSFHNGLLTESVTSSLVLIGFSCCLRVVRGTPKVQAYMLCALAVIVLVTQFRSYWGAIVALMVLYSLFSRGLLFSRWTVVLFAVSACSALAFPGYRYLQTGQFFLPSGGINRLISASQVNFHPSPDITTIFENADLPPSLAPSDALTRGINMSDALLIAEKWRTDGLSNLEIDQKAGELAGMLINDGIWVQLNRSLYGLASIGAISQFDLLPPTYAVFPAYSPSEFGAHLYAYYRWHSWIGLDDYRPTFERFFGPAAAAEAAAFPFSAGSNAAMHSAFGQYITTSTKKWRDPIGIGNITPDLWLALALLAAGILARRARVVSVLLICSVLPAFAVAYAFPVGNTRYAVPLFPLYFFVTSIAAAYLVAGSALGPRRQRGS